MTTALISGRTSLCLIIGDPVAHSLTPRMHNAAYAAAALDYCMAAAPVTDDQLADAIVGVRALSIRGLSVTMPHKVAICRLLDMLDPVAGAIGAVNTVVNSSGYLKGFNTDWLGILRPLERRLSLKGARVAVLGAGGAAQAAVYACHQSKAQVTVLNRSADKAKLVAGPYQYAWGELSATVDVGMYDVIINTTSVGMKDLIHQSPIAASQLSKQQLVFETIYAPRETVLLQNARSVGCSIITGDEMFLEQGAAQFELHTGQPAPREAMQLALAPDQLSAPQTKQNSDS
jgi:shikimate dehydrogenase